MSESEAYEGVDGDSGGPVRDAVPPGAQVAAASALLEAVARERGLDVRRLDDEIVVCGDRQRRVLFHGLVSSSTGKLVHALCGNDAWLRSHLARHGLPVVPTRLVGVDDADFAQRAAGDLGYPVRMRLADEPGDARTVDDADSFHLAWGAMVASCPDPRQQAILDAAPSGAVVQVPVVAGEAVPISGTGEAVAAQDEMLALRAARVLPGSLCGLVCLVATESGRLVDRVILPTVAGDETRRFIDALIKAEFGRRPVSTRRSSGTPKG